MHLFYPSALPRRRARAAVATLVCALAVAWSAAPGGAATSGTVIDATIPTVTTIDTAGCLPGVANRTHFGAVLPGASAVLSTPCSLVIDSNVSTTALMVSQADGLGAPMFQPSRGPLDLTFDPGGAEGAGKARSDFGGSTDQIRYLELLPDGNIVAGGTSTADLSVARYLPNGTLDATFSPGGADGDGRLRIPGPSGENLYSMTVQPDGMILLAGQTTAATDDVIVARVTTAGILDPTFGPGGADGNGIVTITRAGSSEQPYGIKALPSGRIYVSGLGWSTPTDMFVLALDAVGNLDATFSPGGADGNGAAALDFAGGTDFAYAMDIAANGDILVAGSCSSDTCAARIDSTGAYVTTFGPGGADGNGRVTYPAALTDAARSIRELADGDILISGYIDPAVNDDGRVYRLDSTGALDPTFAPGGADGNGVLTVDFTGGDDWLRTIREQPDGKLVMVGVSNNGTNDDYGVVRLLADGTFDPDFGTTGAGGTGRARYDLGFNESGYGLVIADDGSLVFGGSSGGDYGIARLTSDTVLNNAGTWAGGASSFGACLRATSSGTAQWNAVGAGNCVTTTDAAWNPIPTTSAAPNADAVTWSGAFADATVDLQFGVRMGTSQAPGTYIAPITFTLVGT